MNPVLDKTPEYYHSYILLADCTDILTGLEETRSKVISFLKTIPKEREDYRYAAEKWTIKQVVNHIIDNERIMSYRALRFSRNDRTELPGYEQDDYAPEDNSAHRSLDSLIREFSNLRISTIDLFQSFSAEMLSRSGTASGAPISVEALGHVIIGHALHHKNVMKERYTP